MDGHVPSELHGKWVDPVNVTPLKPCGLNGSQKDSKSIYCFGFAPGDDEPGGNGNWNNQRQSSLE
jgi:hypothetical protein